MNLLFENARKSLGHQLAETGATVTADRVPSIISDRLALEQVFSNLIENAVKYQHPERVGEVRVTAVERGPLIEFRVKDNGRGIDPRDHERVFDLFRRAGTQDRPGEGIGLAHVRALVRRLGGSISVESALGEGSTFVVTLPRRLKEEGSNA